MGCGISSEGTSGVLSNTVTQNGDAHLSPDSVAKAVSDLNLSDPDLEQAATRIQAVYRGHRTRKTLPEDQSKTDTEKSQPEMAQQEEEVDIDLNDPEVAQAATKIQASFRGHKARKETEKVKQEAELTKELDKLQTNKEEGAEEQEIDLSDPELNKAATLIQAQFRGHMVRKPKDDGL